MIKEIRKHIVDSIKSVDTKYVTVDQPYGKDEDVIGTKLPYFYNITFGATTNEIVEAGGTVSNVSVNLKTYVQGTRDKLSDFDEGYCQAIMIDSLIVDRSLYIGSQYIKNIESTGVTPIEVLDSQDVYAFESTFNIKLSYGLGD